MLAASAEPNEQFTRRDLIRLIAAWVLLVAAMSVILGVDILPAQPQLEVGKPAPADVIAPRAATYESDVLTKQARQAASAAVEPQYDFTSEQAAAIADAQAQAFDRRVAPIDAAFADIVAPDARITLLEQALPELSSDQRATLTGLTMDRWKAVRDEASRVLDNIERGELKDTEVAAMRDRLAGQMGGDLDANERDLAAALISPLVVANSAYSDQLTATARQQAAAAVEPVTAEWQRGDIIVRIGDRVSEAAAEAITYFNLNEGGLDVARLLGSSSCR